MSLLPGCRLAVAPRFHLPINWSDRLLLGAGVAKVDGKLLPRPPWRAATEHELALLVHDSVLPITPENLAQSLCLFQIPQHLWLTFWKMLDQASEKGETRLEGFDAFADKVTRFLAFKGLIVPDGAACEVVVKQPGQQPILGCRVPWAGINLGDEPTSIVFINLTAELMRSQLDEQAVAAASPQTPGEWAELFLGRHNDYPPIRLRLEPREGYLLPAGGLPLDDSTLDANGPALSFVIHM